MYYGTLYIKVEDNNVLKFYTNISKDEQYRDRSTVSKTPRDTIVTFDDPEDLKDVLISLYVGLVKDKTCVRNHDRYEEVCADKCIVSKNTIISAGPAFFTFSSEKDHCKLVVEPVFSTEKQTIKFSDTGKKPITEYLKRMLDEKFQISNNELRNLYRERLKYEQ